MDGGGHGGHGGDIGGRGSSQESAPDVKLIRCDEHAIISARSFGVAHLLGLAFLAFGLYMGVGGFFINFPDNLIGAFFVLGFGLIFAAFGCAMLCPTSLYINVPECTYRERTGWRFLGKVTEGALQDFTQVSLRTCSEHGRGTTLLLHWRDVTRKPYALHTDRLEEARRQGIAVASLLGLPGVYGEIKRETGHV